MTGKEMNREAEDTGSFRIVPKDVVIYILCAMDPCGILMLEQTCKYFRDLVVTRQVWLVQLRKLDQTCAPDLPPHVDVKDLSCQQLRELVVTAVRSYKHYVEGCPQYDLRHKVVLSKPEGCRQSVDKPFEMQLSPGGQYLFVYWKHHALQLYDLHRKKACVWVYKTKQNSPILNISGYAFELHKGGLITVLMILSEADCCKYEVYRLCCVSPRRGTMVGRLVSEVFNASNNVVPYINGDHAAIVQLTSSSVTILNWKQDRMARVSLPSACTVSSRLPIIWQDHFFFITLSSRFHSLRAISLQRLFSLCTTKEISVTLSEAEECSVEIKEANLLFQPSLCDFRWKSCEERASPKISMAMATSIRLAGYPGMLKYKAFEIMFDKDALLGSTLTLLKQPPSLENLSMDIFSFAQCRFMQIQSKRALLRREHILEGLEGHSMIWMDQTGSIRISRLPKDLNIYIIKNGEGITHFNISVEYYSGALACLTTDEKAVDIWYPA